MDEWMGGWMGELIAMAIAIAKAMCLHCSYYLLSGFYCHRPYVSATDSLCGRQSVTDSL